MGRQDKGTGRPQTSPFQIARQHPGPSHPGLDFEIPCEGLHLSPVGMNSRPGHHELKLARDGSGSQQLRPGAQKQIAALLLVHTPQK